MPAIQNPYDSPQSETAATEPLSGRGAGYRAALACVGFLGAAVFLICIVVVTILTGPNGNLSALWIVAPMAVISLGCTIYMLRRAWGRG